MVAGESCCGELVVPDGVVSRKYKILYFPRFQYEESIKFSYFSRIQTEAIKQMVTGESCCGEWVVSDGVGPQGRGPHDLLGVSDVQQKFYGGRGRGG